MGPFRWVKYSPIFDSNLAVLVRANTVQLRRAEIGPSEGWNGLLIELFFFVQIVLKWLQEGLNLILSRRSGLAL